MVCFLYNRAKSSGKSFLKELMNYNEIKLLSVPRYGALIISENR
jgi:hypothetical protein